MLCPKRCRVGNRLTTCLTGSRDSVLSPVDASSGVGASVKVSPGYRSWVKGNRRVVVCGQSVSNPINWDPRAAATGAPTNMQTSSEIARSN